ncbi:MAG: hypothetical protein R2827_15585 [Bdellovibrionales bacterium]
MTALKGKAQQIKSRLPEHEPFQRLQKLSFTRNGFYSGIRLLTAIEGYQSPLEISEHFQLPLQRVREVLDFLVQNNLLP